MPDWCRDFHATNILQTDIFPTKVVTLTHNVNVALGIRYYLVGRRRFGSLALFGGKCVSLKKSRGANDKEEFEAAFSMLW